MRDQPGPGPEGPNQPQPNSVSLSGHSVSSVERSGTGGEPQPQNKPNLSAAQPLSVSSVAKEGRGRGGKRPGAGAPRGNLNALKHGRYSRQFAEIGAVLVGHPDIRDALLGAARRRGQRNHRAEEIAADLMVRLYNNAAEVAAGRASPGPFRDIVRLSSQRRRLSPAQSNARRDILAEALAQIAGATRNPRVSEEIDQPPAGQSKSVYEKAAD